MTLEEKAARGMKAAALLEDPIFREAHEAVQARILEDFAKTDPADTGAMQVLRLKLSALAEVVREVKSVIDTGKIAAHEMKQEGEREQYARRMGLRR